ncbi:Striated Muscle Preferentially Expressed Protein Kinase [Manis pentadactyla]|nr:Striated Muscle Preferentially Expressed Protein Kinase [Manis pentadactyla]
MGLHFGEPPPPPVPRCSDASGDSPEAHLVRSPQEDLGFQIGRRQNTIQDASFYMTPVSTQQLKSQIIFIAAVDFTICLRMVLPPHDYWYVYLFEKLKLTWSVVDFGQKDGTEVLITLDTAKQSAARKLTTRSNDGKSCLLP